MAKTNVITTEGMSDIQAREIDFVTQFTQNFQALMDLLSVSRTIEKTSGTDLVMKRVKVTLAQSVAEGETIPYSPASFESVSAEKIILEKYSTGTTLEAISENGGDVSVDKVDQALRAEIASAITNKLYTALAQGELEGNATTFQKRLAKAKAKVLTHFEQLSLGITGVIGWANTEEFYDWAGDREITVQQLFGLTYVKNFLGYDILFLSSYVPEGKVIATAKNNLNIYSVNPADPDFAKAGLVYTSDETGLIGTHVQGDYNTAVAELFAICGVKLFPEFADGIAVISTTTADDDSNETVTP